MVTPVTDADAALLALRYWAPVLAVVNLLIFTMGIPALKWLWDLKNNHMEHIQASTTKTVELLEEQGKTLIEIATILRERK